MRVLQEAKLKNERKSVLQDHELDALWHATKFDRVYEAQRFHLAVFGFRTGYRPESMMRLAAKGFQEGKLEDGRRYILPILSTMKNHSAELDKAELALLTQMVVETPECPRFGTHEDVRSTVSTVRVCAVEAYYRQLTLLPDTEGLLFRSASRLSPALAKDGLAYASFRGCALWASEVCHSVMTRKFHVQIADRQEKVDFPQFVAQCGLHQIGQCAGDFRL